ncbi:hypothetical protein MTR67_022838 [Solanum verrucosum]|uniref:DUF4216 domain-containing protein n=1 Tax=Solanum verrucosum TaxID=315347 RepID=A0AAF0TY74_SOLVR|nr:hypothetical protein MTR67_022838 [Solanum verrucosum]
MVPVQAMHYLPLIPRLKRLYASMRSASHMRWHREYRRPPGVLSHPSDGEAWKHFDNVYPDFASEPRNVRLGLCLDGFTPFSNNASPYSCWPVFLTPYDLPSEMCMISPYIFLSCVIPGPRNPKSLIDVYLQPLIDELKQLWFEGVLTYDISTKQNFIMRASLMWTINDFPAYGMLSGWMTAGKLACPYCIENSKAFTLKHGIKNTWFDCHRQFLPMDHEFRKMKNAFRKKKVESDPPPPLLTGHQIWERISQLPKVTEALPSRLPGYGVEHNWTKQNIFWELPYWKDNLLRHNLDVMHIEKNYFDNLFNTVMDVKEIQSYVNLFVNTWGNEAIYTKIFKWLRNYVYDEYSSVQHLQLVKEVALGPQSQVLTMNKYCVNGFKFQTEEVSRNKKTNNSGVYIQGDVNGTGQTIEYYGVIQEIIEVRYSGWPNKKIVLFQCEWFDPSHRGIKVDHQHNIIEVKHTRKYKSYDLFIIVQHAKQVYYASYPLRRDKADWWVVIKSKPVGRIEIDNVLNVAYQNDVAIVQQQVDVELETTLQHPQHTLEEVSDDEILNVEEEISENEENESFDDEE